MKRIVPALAAAILGSGCVVTTDPCQGTFTVDWSQFLDADGFTYYSCANAGVSSVDVYVDGVRYSAPCTDYSMVIAAQEGTHSVVVEGLDAGGYILYRDSYPSTTVACSMDTPVASTPSEGWVEMASTFATGTCSTYYPTWLWFSIVDYATNQVTWNSYTSGTAYPTCSYDNEGIWLRLPAGSYNLQGVDEVYYSAPNYYVARSDCMNANFSVSGGLASYLYPYLVYSATGTSWCF